MPAHSELRARCEALGLRRLISAESMVMDAVFAIDPEADLDGRFKALDLETGQLGYCNGWNWEFHDDAEGRASVAAEWWDWRDPA